MLHGSWLEWADLDWGDRSNLALLHASLNVSKASPGLSSQQWEKWQRQPSAQPNLCRSSFTSVDIPLPKASHMGEPYAFCQGLGQLPIHREQGGYCKVTWHGVLKARADEELGPDNVRCHRDFASVFQSSQDTAMEHSAL